MMNAASEPPLLEIRELSLRFRNQQMAAIDRVSLSVAHGQTLGLVGASGAGKSSIARAILRLVEVDQGEILFNGKNIYNMSPRQLMACRQRIQIVFQDPSASLSPKRTVAQTLLEPLEHFGIGKPAERMQTIKQVLNTVGLDAEGLQYYPHQFSSGQQQRIAIARALVTQPDLLIADEAVSSLDVSVQAQILQLIQSLQKNHGIAFLFISHDLAVIRQIADEVAVMYQGQILEQAPADIFFSRPAHPYSRSLLSFLSPATPGPAALASLQLNRAPVTASGTPSACVYTATCGDIMPVCEQSEPAMHAIEHKNQRTAGLHCVRCHLYDEANTHDT